MFICLFVCFVTGPLSVVLAGFKLTQIFLLCLQVLGLKLRSYLVVLDDLDFLDSPTSAYQRGTPTCATPPVLEDIFEIFTFLSSEILGQGALLLSLESTGQTTQSP